MNATYCTELYKQIKLLYVIFGKYFGCICELK